MKNIKNSIKTVASLNAALMNARNVIQSPVKITVSNSNSKLGNIPSVSLAPIFTCANCFAFPSHHKAMAKNTVMAERFPDAYWQQVNVALTLTRYFRFHVTGDIPNRDYLDRMISAVQNNAHCHILVFTKRYEMVNDWITEHGELPENLQIIFSRWPGMECNNRYNLPESHVIFAGTTEIPDDWMVCPGACDGCAARGCGCWTMGKGEKIALKEH